MIKYNCGSSVSGTQYKLLNKQIPKEEIKSKCRLCKEYKETIDHLTKGCPILAMNEYPIRQDKVCIHLYH